MLVSKIWEEQPLLILAIDQFKEEVQHWNKSTFGNLFKRKHKLLARLGGIQLSMQYPTSLFLQKLEQDLINEFKIILNKRKIFENWNQELIV